MQIEWLMAHHFYCVVTTRAAAFLRPVQSHGDRCRQKTLRHIDPSVVH